MQVVDPTPIEAPPFGLLSVVTDLTGRPVPFEGVTLCEPPSWNESTCDPFSKEASDLSSFVSVPATVWQVVECKGPGEEALADEVLMANLVAGTPHALEEALADYLDTNSTALSASTYGSRHALAFAEYLAGSDYAGRVVLHTASVHANIAGNPVARHGMHLETKTGALVSAGTGYPLDVIYATGPVLHKWGPPVMRSAFDVLTNTHVRLVEQQHWLGVTCLVGHVEVDAGLGTGGGGGGRWHPVRQRGHRPGRDLGRRGRGCRAREPHPRARGPRPGPQLGVRPTNRPC